MAMFLIMKCKLIEDTLDQFRLMNSFYNIALTNYITALFIISFWHTTFPSNLSSLVPFLSHIFFRMKNFASQIYQILAFWNFGNTLTSVNVQHSPYWIKIIAITHVFEKYEPPLIWDLYRNLKTKNEIDKTKRKKLENGVIFGNSVEQLKISRYL